MTTYYISPSGSDANNGLGPDASHASNKPWLTIGKALATGSVVVPGDTVYIAPGFYFSSVTAVIAGVSSTASPTTIEGDPTNKQGFKDGSGVRLAAGIVLLTSKTSAEGIDGGLADSSDLFDLATSGVDGLTFRKLHLECRSTGTCGIFAVNLATNADLTVEDCRLNGQFIIRHSAGAPTAARNYVVRRSIIIGSDFISLATTTAAATANADLNITFEYNIGLSSAFGTGIAIGASGGGNIGGGIEYRRNLLFADGTALSTVASRVSTTTPIRVTGNVVYAAIFVNAGTAGQVVDDGYTFYTISGSNTNFTSGVGIKQRSTPLMQLPDLIKWGIALPFDDILGWSPNAGDECRHGGSAGVGEFDFRGSTAIPWGAGFGGGSTAYGPWEALDQSKDTGSQITGGGSNSLKINGAGRAGPFFARVDAALTTFSVITKSSGYGGTNYPRLIIDPAPDIGYAGETIAAASAAEQTLTSASFTPTAKGVVRYWLESRSNVLTSFTYFDRVTAS